MTNLLTIIFLLIGAILIFVASVGILRMPDLYLRMSATTKAATLGVGCLLVATAVYFHNIDAYSRAVAIIFFLFLTSPVAAHRLGRAAYIIGVPVTDKTIVNELADVYKKEETTDQANPKGASYREEILR